jgi:hypothetical protein
MLETEWIEFENVTCKTTTLKAGLYVIDGEEHWIPWSQVRDGSVDKDQSKGDLAITQWIAEQKNLV